MRSEGLAHLCCTMHGHASVATGMCAFWVVRVAPLGSPHYITNHESTMGTLILVSGFFCYHSSSVKALLQPVML